ncbi:MAG: hypothetical protein HYY37_04585 [Candidatus Aenigmarchaeota archaeon]|nr:hypothetical protein [Candidatus Aenigmarchaeota archaeon]
MSFHEALGQSGILVIILFILFVIAIKKSYEILKNVILIAGAAILFPLVMNNMLGFSLSTSADAVVMYITAGVGLYLLYLFAKSIYTFLGIVEKSAKAAASPVRKVIKKKSAAQDNDAD